MTETVTKSATGAIERALRGFPARVLKALVYIAEGRVTVLLANKSGIRLEVRGSRREPYTVRYGREGGRIITECSCFASEVRPIHPKCSHVECARLLWRE